MTSNLQRNIGNTLALQDIELASAISELRGDPARLTDFISNRKAALYTTVTREHSDNFQRVFGDLQRASDTTKNILYYHVRNKDLDRTQQAVYDKAKGEADNATIDSQNAKRQFEINEWTVGNKQDTLFFLQLLFISLCVTAPLLYMSRAGMIPNGVFYGVSGIVLLALILTVVVRAQYTTQSRDNHFWNRRRFAQMGGPPTVPSCDAIQGLAARAAQSGQNVFESSAATFEQVQSSVTNPSGTASS
jgi:hypothetical protein